MEEEGSWRTRPRPEPTGSGRPARWVCQKEVLMEGFEILAEANRTGKTGKSGRLDWYCIL